MGKITVIILKLKYFYLKYITDYIFDSKNKYIGTDIFEIL